jgi:hypothetical protein
VTTKARKAPRQTVARVQATVVAVVAGAAMPGAAVPANPTPWVTVPAVDRAQRKVGAVTVVGAVVVAMAVAVVVEVAATAPARPEQPRASLTRCAPVWT